MMPICPYDQSPLRAAVRVVTGEPEIYCTDPATHTWDENGLLISGGQPVQVIEAPLTVTVAEVRPVPLQCPHDGTLIRLGSRRVDSEGWESWDGTAGCPNGHRWDDAGQPEADELPDEPPLFSRVVTVADTVWCRLNSVRNGWYTELAASKNGTAGEYGTTHVSWELLNHAGPAKLLPPQT